MATSQDLNELIQKQDLFKKFVIQYDFSELKKHPIAYSQFKTHGIGIQLWNDPPNRGKYDYSSGQLTANFTEEVEPMAWGPLQRVADDFAQFVVEFVN